MQEVFGWKVFGDRRFAMSTRHVTAKKYMVRKPIEYTSENGERKPQYREKLALMGLTIISELQKSV